MCLSSRRPASVRCSAALLSPKTEIAVLQFQSSLAHSLTSVLHYLVPVRPRRQIVYPLEKLGINAPSESVSKEPVGSRGSSRQGGAVPAQAGVADGWQLCLRRSRLLLNYREPGSLRPAEAPRRCFPSGDDSWGSLKAKACDLGRDRAQGDEASAGPLHSRTNGLPALPPCSSPFLKSRSCPARRSQCFAFKASWSFTIQTKLTKQTEPAACCGRVGLGLQPLF